MRKPAALTLILVFVVVVGAMLVRASSDERPLQQVLGVFVNGPVVALDKGHTGCQGPIGLTDSTSRIEFNPGTPHAVPGPAMDATIRAAGTSRVLAGGRLRAGFDPRVPQTVSVTPAVRANTIVDICFGNLGPRRVLLFGDKAYGGGSTGFLGVHPTIVTSSASLDGKQLSNGDIAVVFPRSRPKSVLALVPEMFRRAALFRPGWLGVWTYWLLAALVLIGAPLLLARAAASADEEPEEAALPSSRR
jgi:hypothetical protein